MSKTNKKILFLLLAALLCCAGCQSPQVTRQNEMAEAARIVDAQFSGQLTPEQRAYLVQQVYDRMEQDRQARQIAQAQMIANGFQKAGAQIAESSKPAPTIYVQQPPQPMQIPPPGPPQFVPIPTGY
jgi:hypothetical protein